jgi:hypothetical protein
MERRGVGGTATVEDTAIRRALGRTEVSSLLNDEEERTLRMRYGAAVELSTPLPRAAGTNAELADELTLIEMQLLRAMRAHGRQPGPRKPERGVNGVSQLATSSSRTKDKIVRGLRKKR